MMRSVHLHTAMSTTGYKWCSPASPEHLLRCGAKCQRCLRCSANEYRLRHRTLSKIYGDPALGHANLRRTIPRRHLRGGRAPRARSCLPAQPQGLLCIGSNPACRSGEQGTTCPPWSTSGRRRCAAVTEKTLLLARRPPDNLNQVTQVEGGTTDSEMTECRGGSSMTLTPATITTTMKPRPGTAMTKAAPRRRQATTTRRLQERNGRRPGPVAGGPRYQEDHHQAVVWVDRHDARKARRLQISRRCPAGGGT